MIELIKMNINEAEEVWEKLREIEENIPCIISTSKISGEGLIVDSHRYNDVTTFDVIIDNLKHEIVCYGINLISCKS